MFSYAGLGTELTHIPLTLVNSFSASHKSSKTNATSDPHRQGVWRHGQPCPTVRCPAVRATGMWTGHGLLHPTQRHGKIQSEEKKKNMVWVQNKKIVREQRENLRTSQLQVPSTPTLVINLWGLASLYRDCFHQTAQAINQVAADMLFNKSVGAPFPIQTSKEFQMAWCYFWAAAIAS